MRIIEAAIQVFAREGLVKGKIVDIAKEAGIGKGTVYEYFRSKEEIFSAIEESLMDNIFQALEKIAATSLSPAKKLEAIMNKCIYQIVAMGHGLLIVTEIWAQAGREHWHTHQPANLAGKYDRFRELIVRILRQGIETGEFRPMNEDGVATLLMAFIDGLSWQYVLLRDSKRFWEIKTEAVRSFMKGIER